MKIILTILLLFFFTVGFAQLQDIAPGEYRVVFLKDSTAYIQYWIDGVGLKLTPFNGGHKFAEVNGGLYSFLLRKSSGEVYLCEKAAINLQFLQYDTLNIPFKAISVDCHLQSYYAVRADGTIWMTGYNSAKQFGTNANTILKRWAKIPGQPAVKFKSCVKGGANGNGTLVALTETGDVYTVADGSTTWVKKTLPGAAQKVYGSVNNFYIALIGGYPYGWGSVKYLNNGTGIISTPISLKDYWGLTAPVKDMAVNDNTIHYITADGRLFGYGDNSMGEVGNGYELVNKAEYKGKRYVYNWVMPTMPAYQPQAFVPKPVHIAPGKLFKRIFGGGYYAFYKYAQDTEGNLYSWGRNKAAVLNNGMAISNESDLPNWGDVVVPTRVDPFNTITPSPGIFIPGFVFAGPDETITTGSTILIGSVTPSRGKNFTYDITDYQWRQLTGPSCTIESPGSAVTKITGMTTGVYSFVLQTTDIQTGTMADTVQVTVLVINKPPAVEIYCNKVVIDSSLILNGKVSDPDGKIMTVSWEKISGPAGSEIKSYPHLPLYAIEVVFREPGEYVYQLTATDDKGASSQALVTLIVYGIGKDNYIIIRK